MRRWLLSLTCVTAVSAVVGVIGTPVASAQQSLNLYVGGFLPTDLHSRGSTTNGFTNDVLVNNYDFLAYDFGRFTGPTFGGEWLIGLGNHFDAGLGVSYYQQSVPAVDADFVKPNGDEVVSHLKLRIVPFTATFRWLPVGHNAPIQPYIGAGVGVFGWRYSESGEFVDSSDRSIFTGNFEGSGAATGPVVLGGVRVPIGRTAIGFEARYQHAKGELPRDQEFSGSEIDLGGMNYLFTFNIRF
jgi:hypothetical protein